LEDAGAIGKQGLEGIWEKKPHENFVADIGRY
jgi:hypothetical protein